MILHPLRGFRAAVGINFSCHDNGHCFIVRKHTTDARGATGGGYRHLRWPLPDLHGPGSQAAMVGLSKQAGVSLVARPGSCSAVARLVARSHDAGNGDRGPRREAALGTGGDPVSHAAAAQAVVGFTIFARSGEHDCVAARVSMDCAESLSTQRRSDLQRGDLLAAPLIGRAFDCVPYILIPNVRMKSDGPRSDSVVLDRRLW